MAAEAVGPSGRVVGVDLAAVEPPLEFANAFSFSGDLAEAAVLEELLARLGGPADVLLSDAAPKLTGVRATDRAREEALLAAVEAAVPRLLAPGGALLVKLLDCPEAAGFVKRMRARFDSARELRPAASRAGSSERYLLARGHRPCAPRTRGGRAATRACLATGCEGLQQRPEPHRLRERIEPASRAASWRVNSTPRPAEAPVTRARRLNCARPARPRDRRRPGRR